jgi:hypothetical protein
MTSVLGGGVIFVVAALLWAAVLVPSWVRRREFKAAERNAVRLQRTLRVLAETAEVPTEVRVEATAREALAHEKLLRTAQRRQEAERQAKLSEARAAQVRAEMRAQQMRRKQSALSRSARLRRPFVRRLRALNALIALLALAGALVGIGFVVAGQGYAVLGIAGLVFVAALGGLVLMAPGRVKVAEIPAERLPEASRAETVIADAEIDAKTEDGAAAAHAAAQAAAAARIERARAMARARAERPEAVLKNRPDSMLLVQTGREQQASGEADATAAPASIPAQPRRLDQAAARRAQQLATAERLRKMGVIDDPSEGMLDLDAALRQRRSAG